MIRATLSNGDVVELAPKYGRVSELVEQATAETLTGSAVPLTDVELDTADGRKIRYGDVNLFEEDRSFT